MPSRLPMHLDVREFIRLIESGKPADAWKLYSKAIPLAPIIAHTCDAPCREVCKRAQLGGAIEIPLLEQAVSASAGSPSRVPFMLPKKNERVAIIGGGLRGMAAASFLARKGYKVTIFEARVRLGVGLLPLVGKVLPEAVLEGEIKSLLNLLSL